MPTVRKIAQGIGVAILGALGMGAYQVGWHAYVDHKQLHAIIRLITAAKQQQVNPAPKTIKP